jgi:hypothetical protein
MQFASRGGNSPSPLSTGGGGSAATWGKQIDNMWYVPLWTGLLLSAAVGASSTAIATAGSATALVAGHVYCFSSNVGAWICQSVSSSPTAATKGAGSMYVGPGVERLIDGSQGGSLTVIEDGSGGQCSLVEVTV